MAKRIYVLSLIFSFLVLLCSHQARAQKKIPKQLRDSTKIKEKEYKAFAKHSIDSAQAYRKNKSDSIAARNNPDTLPFRKDLRIGLDFSKPITSFFRNDRQQFEVSADYHFRSRYYLSAEAGYEHVRISEPKLYTYRSTGEYLRAGFDYSIFHLERAYDNNIIYIGLRAAAANVSYSAQEIIIPEPYFGKSTAALPSASTRAYWLEVVFGIKIELAKRISMGWAVRVCSGFTDLTTRPTYPLFIPGFGNSSKSQNFTYNYSIFYSF